MLTSAMDLRSGRDGFPNCNVVVVRVKVEMAVSRATYRAENSRGRYCTVHDSEEGPNFARPQDLST